MNATTAIATVINIAFIICVFFAVPIVMPVASALATLLIIFGSFYVLGIIGQIYLAYRPAQQQ